MKSSLPSIGCDLSMSRKTLCPWLSAAGVTSIAVTLRGFHHWWLFRWNDSFCFKTSLCMGEYWQRPHDCHLKVCLWPAEPEISAAMHSLEKHTHTHTVLLYSTAALFQSIKLYVCLHIFKYIFVCK